MFVPNKITVRLDYTNQQNLQKYLEVKINRTPSQVVRAALNRYLAEELAKIEDDRIDCQLGEASLSDKFGLTKPKGSVQK